MLPTLMAYVGGKARQAKWIAGHIDATPHTTYLEPCCGSAAVFFAKHPSKIEILNDQERRFALLFRALRDHPQQVIDFCSRIEYSKAAFDESYQHLRDEHSPLEPWKLGAWALFQCVASHSGYPDAHSFAWRLKGSNPAAAWQAKLGSLGPYVQRLQRVTFLDYDIFAMLDKADKPDKLIYVDPPYFGAEFRYKCTKGSFDHAELALQLHAMRHARVIISHYDAEPYQVLYADWRKEVRPTTQSCRGSTEDSLEATEPVTEAIWFNWSAEQPDN